MKLKEFARSTGVTYDTAWRWWKAGYLDAVQLPTGTIIVNGFNSFAIKSPTMADQLERYSKDIKKARKSTEKAKRQKLLALAKERRISQRQAAEWLGLSLRYIKKLMKELPEKVS